MSSNLKMPRQISINRFLMLVGVLIFSQLAIVSSWPARDVCRDTGNCTTATTIGEPGKYCNEWTDSMGQSNSCCCAESEECSTGTTDKCLCDGSSGSPSYVYILIGCLVASLVLVGGITVCIRKRRTKSFPRVLQLARNPSLQLLVSTEKQIVGLVFLQDLFYLGLPLCHLFSRRISLVKADIAVQHQILPLR